MRRDKQVPCHNWPLPSKNIPVLHAAPVRRPGTGPQDSFWSVLGTGHHYMLREDRRGSTLVASLFFARFDAGIHRTYDPTK